MHPVIIAARNELLRYAVAGFQTSGDRSIALQARLYREWQEGRRRYPVAPPGQSYHNFGRAFDLSASNLAELGRLWRSWGGTYFESDPVHFQA